MHARHDPSSPFIPSDDKPNTPTHPPRRQPRPTPVAVHPAEKPRGGVRRERIERQPGGGAASAVLVAVGGGGGGGQVGIGLGIQSASPVRRPPHLQIEGRGFVPRRVVPEPAGEVPPVEGVPHGHALCGSCAVVWVPISRLPIQLHANAHARARCDAIPPACRPAGWAWRAPRGSHTCRRGS